MRLLIGLVITLAFTTGCTLISAPEVQWVDSTTQLQWPAPPDKARIIFLRDFKGPGDFEKTSSSQKFLTWLTGERDKKLPFIAPYGIAADGLGRIWVADMGIRGVHQVDLAKGKVSYIFSAGNTPLTTPAGVAVDVDRQRLYVSDTTLAKVFLFDLEGRFLKEWDAPDNFGRPAGLAVDKFGQLYVVDAIKNRLSVFSPDGELLRTITSAILPELTFSTPSNVAVNAQGQIFVVDSMNFRVEFFSARGESLGTIGSIGDGPGYFARPRGIAIDGDGHIYVADATFDNVQVFDNNGKLLLHFGQPGKKQPGEFSLPAGMTIDQHNRLYVVDSFNQRLQVFEYLP
ncbi:MAG: 6-bladed beta-propeller [Desulfuromonadales bacterium]|nr:6-bladed beta-propeller [Desulfuromonadales bacterium]